MSPWRQNPLEEIELPSGSKIEIEIRGVPARHRDLWVLLHGLHGSRKKPLIRKLLRRFRETASVVVAPDFKKININDGCFVLDHIWNKWGKISKRLFLLGFSYGGAIATFWAGENKDKPSAVVLLAPAFKIAEKMENIKIKDYFKRIASPILIIQGTSDDTVYWEDSLDFLKTKKDLCELTLLPNVGHVFESFEDKVFLRIRAFWKTLSA